MKRLVILLLLDLFILLSCQYNKAYVKLAEIDTLILREQYDSAYHLLNMYNNAIMGNKMDIAHYNLQKVQVAYLVNKPLASSDSLLSCVITFYKRHVDHEKLADAFYYRAIGKCKEKDYKQSVLFYKEAEQYAKLSGNKRQQYKIAEGLSFVNGRCANYDLQLVYAKEALKIAQSINRKEWIAYSYYRLGVAFSKYENVDSVLCSFSKIKPYLRYVKSKDLPILLSSLGTSLKNSHPNAAKEYLLESLKYCELTSSYIHLADVYYNEGNYEEAYRLWKKALTVQSATLKDAAIRNIIEYDMKRGKTDSICERINEIIAIRDSIDAKLKNDTIKDLQTRFDHEVAMHEKDQMVIKWQWITIILVVLLLIGTVYYLVRKYQVRIKLQRSQMQINDYMEQIRALQSDKGDRTNEIERLNKQIERIMEEKSPRLAQGRMLYDMVVANKKMSRWKKDDVKKFIEYYTATNYRVVNRLRSIPRKEELTPHHLLYLILQEMGKTDQEIRLILSISKETLRTLRFRTKPLDEAESEKSDQAL